MHRLTSRQRLAGLVLTMIAVAFIALDLTGGSLGEAHSGARGVLGGLYRGSDSVLGPVRRYLQALPGAGHQAAEVTELENENAGLEAKLAAEADDTAVQGDLAQLRLAAATTGMTIVPARVIAFGSGLGFDWTVTIDIGRTSGVAVDQTVTSAPGLVGRVLRVDTATSVVLMAVDPGSGVGVRDARSGELALATGAGSSGFTLTPLDPSADLRVGDPLETGPAGSSTFAAGLPVATITAVHATSTGVVSASARSALKPTTVNLVGVIESGSTAAAAPRAPLTGGAR
jgi:rod shape-determining protein MreC